jgi:phenylacetate-CoA ligase
MIYAKLLNGVFLPLHSSIKGRKYVQFRRFVEESQWWATEKLEEFQFEELRKVLRIAFDSVPFYRKRYAEAGVRFDDIQTPADLRKLPVLERDDVKRFKNELCSTTYCGKLLSHSTGGSTGTPIQFYRSPESYDWRTAVTDRSYAWTGAILGNRVLYLWGAPTGHPFLWSRTKLNAYRWIRNEFVIDSFHRGPGFWHNVDKTIHTVGPAAIVGYTSNIEELCAFAQERCLRFPSLKGVVAAAETVYPDLRERVKEAFGVPLFNTYGSREFMSIAVECGHGGFHVNMENIYLENDEEGRQSDLLVTDLHNDAMPFIRYRIGDTGLLSQDQCACGRGLIGLAALEGKTVDQLQTPSGSKVSGVLVRHVLKDVAEVRQYQAEQTEYDRIVLRVVVQRPLSNGSREYLNTEFRKAIGSRLRLEIEEMSEIPRSASGKLRSVIGLPMDKLGPSTTAPDVPVMAAQH